MKSMDKILLGSTQAAVKSILAHAGSIDLTKEQREKFRHHYEGLLDLQVELVLDTPSGDRRIDNGN